MVRRERRETLLPRLRELLQEVSRAWKFSPERSAERRMWRRMRVEINQAITPRSEASRLGDAERADEARIRREQIAAMRQLMREEYARHSHVATPVPVPEERRIEAPADLGLSPWGSRAAAVVRAGGTFTTSEASPEEFMAALQDWLAYRENPQSHESPFMQGLTEHEQELWWEQLPTILEEGGYLEEQYYRDPQGVPSSRLVPTAGTRRQVGGDVRAWDTENQEAEIDAYIDEQLRIDEERRLRDLQYEIEAIEQEAAEVAEAVKADALAQGLPEEQALALAEDIGGGIRLLNDELYDRWEAMRDLVAAREAEQEAAEAEARREKYTSPPPTLSRLREINELARDTIARAERMLGVEETLPAVERPRYLVVTDAAEALAAAETTGRAEDLRQRIIAAGRPKPLEWPVETVVRTLMDQAGVEYTPQMRQIVRDAESDRMARLLAAKQAELRLLVEKGPQAQEWARVVQESRVRSEEARIRRGGVRGLADDPRQIFVKWPDVRIEHRRTLSVVETQTDGLRSSLLREAVEQMFGGRPRMGLGRMRQWGRFLVTELLELRRLEGTPEEQVEVVVRGMEDAGETGLQEPAAYLTAEGEIDMGALPAEARRIFEVADHLRRFYDDLRLGTGGMGPGFEEMKRALGMEPGTVEEYYPQPALSPLGPEDWQIHEDLAMAELVMGQEHVRNIMQRLGRAWRADITRHRTWQDVPEAIRATIESLERGELIEDSIKETDALTAATWYIHQFLALRTVYLVRQWLTDHAHTELDYRDDPNVGNKGVNEMLQSGWGSVNPYGQTPEWAEGYLLPPPLRHAVNGLLASGCRPAFLDAFMHRTLARYHKYVRQWQVLPLETLRFLGTQWAELAGNMASLGLGLFAEPVAGAQGFVLANRLLNRDLLAMMDSYPPNSWAQEGQVLFLNAKDRMLRLITDRWGVTDDYLDWELKEMERHNILAGAVGTHAREEFERYFRGLGWAEDELRSAADAALSVVMNVDRLARTWMYMTLKLQGYSTDEAAAVVREWTVSYDREARRPWHDLPSHALFYWRWRAERLEQYTSLAYKRPGVWLLLAAADDEKERYMGVPSPWLGVYGGVPSWQAADLTRVGVRWNSPPLRGAGDFLYSTEYLQRWDGYYVPYVRFALPQADFAGEVLEFTAHPFGSLLEDLVPVARGVYEVEQGADIPDVMQMVPGIGPWARAARRFPEEVWANIEGVLPGGVALTPELGMEVFLRAAEEGRTPEYCRTPKKYADRPESQRHRYEAEKMRFYYLLERAMRTWATSITVRRVESAVRYMTTEQIDHTIDAIEAGADVRRGPDDTPAQFRRALEKAREARAEGRYHPDYSPNPRNFAEQLGGVPAGISRRFVAPEEEVPAP